MRQAGILAAAGIVALTEMVPRLKEDHLRAALLAEGLSQIPVVSLMSKNPPSNMVFLTLEKEIPLNTHDIAARLKESGILTAPLDPRQLRLVTHIWISDEDIHRSVDAFKTLLRPY